MKLDTKVSNRDKSLLIFLIVILILFVAYYFFFQPGLAQLLATRSELAGAQAELASIDQEIASLGALQTEEKDLLEEIGIKAAPFFYELKDDRLLNQFNTLMVQNGLQMQSYTVTPAAVATIVPPVYNPQVISYPALDLAAKVNPDLNNAGKAENDQGAAGDTPSNNAGNSAAADNQLLFSSISISFIDSTYEAVIGFLKAAEAMNKAIVVTNVTVTAQFSDSSFNGLLQGQIQLDLYALAKPENAEKDFLSFYNTFPSGKANPFN